MATPAYNPTGYTLDETQPGALGIGGPQPLFDTNPLDAYKPVYEQAWRNILGQPDPVPLPQGEVRSGTAALIGNFQKQFAAIVGRTPTEEETNDFVNQALTPSYAAKVLQGGDASGDIARSVKNYVDLSPEINAERTKSLLDAEQKRQEEAGSGLSKKLETLAGEQRGSLAQQISDLYNPIRSRTITEQARLGRLQSPVSNVNLRKVDEMQGKAISSGLSNFAGQQFGAEVDIAKSIQNILENEKNRAQQNYQFQQNLGLQRDATRQQQENNLMQYNLANQLGQAQARAQQDARKVGPLDYINTAFTGAGTLASLFGGNPYGATTGGASFLQKLMNLNKNSFAAPK